MVRLILVTVLNLTAGSLTMRRTAAASSMLLMRRRMEEEGEQVEPEQERGRKEEEQELWRSVVVEEGLVKPVGANTGPTRVQGPAEVWWGGLRLECRGGQSCRARARGTRQLAGAPRLPKICAKKVMMLICRSLSKRRTNLRSQDPLRSGGGAVIARGVGVEIERRWEGAGNGPDWIQEGGRGTGSSRRKHGRVLCRLGARG